MTAALVNRLNAGISIVQEVFGFIKGNLSGAKRRRSDRSEDATPLVRFYQHCRELFYTFGVQSCDGPNYSCLHAGGPARSHGYGTNTSAAGR